MGGLKMKKILNLVLMLIAFAGGVKAQIQFSVGPGVGFNYAIHSSSESDESINHFGALVTSQFDMQFSRQFGVILWVDFYSDMSAKESNEGVSGEYKINYLSFSPTLKYCISGSPFYLFAGPGIGLKTKGKMKIGYEDLSVEGDIPDMKTRFDMRFGAGYEFFLTNKFTLSPFAAFNLGLNDVASDADWQINTLQAGLVLRFNTF